MIYNTTLPTIANTSNKKNYVVAGLLIAAAVAVVVVAQNLPSKNSTTKK